MTWYPNTFFEWLIQRVVHLPWWLNAGLALDLLGLPFALAFLEQLPPVPLVQGQLRSVLFPIVGIVYVIAVDNVWSRRPPGPTTWRCYVPWLCRC